MSKNVLIVDDERDVTLALKKALADTGFEQVDIYNDPLSALSNFKAGLYDLLIVDVVMREMDGFGLYEQIKEIDNRIRVCFITAFEVNYQALRALFSNATTTDVVSCYIRKPFEPYDLVKRVEKELS